MAVLIVGALPPPTGGVVTHVRELERALSAAGVEVTIVDPRRLGPDGRDGRPRLLWHLARARTRGDLVHLHTNGHNRGSWTLAALCGGPRSLLTLHSGLAPAYIREHRLTQAVARRYAHVIAVNREIADALERESTVCAAWSPRSLDLRLAPPGLMQLRRRHRPLLACALAPGHEYGADVLLDAVERLRARLPHLGVVCYGPRTRALGDEVRRRGLGEVVALFGELARERALAVVAACDVFVRPTRADGDAVSVREALALGRTVVASAVGNRPPGVLTFPSGSAAACAELLFHAASTAGVQPIPSTDDSLPALLAIYGCYGVHSDAETLGTALAI